MDAIHTALRLYEKEPNRTLEIAQKAMSLSYGWDQTADAYVSLYHKLLSRSG